MWNKVSWFVSRALGAKARSGRPRREPRRPRLGVEGLESREVPATIRVTTADDVLNPADGKVSLREAIVQANSTTAHDTIVLPAGVFRITLPPNPINPIATGSFDLLASATLVGAGAGRTVVDAQQLDRVFAVAGTGPRSIAVSFQGLLMMRGGRTTGDGGGLLMGNADVTLRDCAVAANRADGHGGGIANALAPGTGNLTLIRTRVSDNSALGVGGGIYLPGNDQGQGSTLRLSGSAVLRNTARADAGGIRAETATLVDCTVSGNTSPTLGGGIRASTVALTNSTVSGNKASDGGGIYAENAAILTNSTVSGNTASGAGGGIYTPRVAELTNSTVSGNVAAREGGGMVADRMRLMNATIARNEALNGGGVFHLGRDRAIVQNTIVALNRALDRRLAGPDVVGNFISQGHNLIGDGTGSTGFGVNGDQVGTAQRPLDPRLGPLQNNGGATLTHALLQGSPAIDRGDSVGAPAADQRGVARPRDGDGNRSRVTDIGAVER